VSAVIGIDLGTTNSLAAVCDERGPRVLRDERGDALVPSVVRFEPDGSVIVGERAKREAPEHPLTTVSSVKRLMGRSVRDAAPDLPFLGYEVVPGERETARVRVPLPGGRELLLSPEEVSARILTEVKRIAERALGRPVSRAVITVPAYFDDAQRQATRTAARLAGLEAVRIVPEPTAAALAYGLGVRETRERTVCVFDMGGGTFDVSVLRLTPRGAEGERDFYEVLAISGDTRLGGDDADHALVELFAREIGEDASSPSARRALLAEAERVKIALSEAESATARIPTPAGARERAVSRGEFEALIEPLVQRALRACGAAMRDAQKKGAGPLDALVMVGGSTRTPLVRRRAKEFFGVEPYTALDPDLVVALGASVQAALVSGAAKGSLLLDAIPLSLGIETASGAVAKLIMRNSTLPAKATEMFSTGVDNQTGIRIAVYQGEREMAADCRMLGEFHLRGLPPMPAGVPQVEVEFSVDVNGVLSVTAHERRSGKRAALQVVPNHGLTPEDVARIERESVTHAREDMTRHRVADLVTNASLDVRWIGDGLAAHRAALDPAYAAELDERLARVKGLVDVAKADWRSVDPDVFYKEKEALDRASVRLQEVSIAASLRSRPAT